MAKPVHVAITRTVKAGCEDAFEDALKVFFADTGLEKASIGAQFLRPLPGSNSRTYGILRSFASKEDRDAFYNSVTFQKWEDTVGPMVEGDYSRRDLHGLEAFFRSDSTDPPAWKMALLTWLGVCPTVQLVSSLVPPSTAVWPFWIQNALLNLFVVAALVWVVMPLLTRIARPWLEAGQISRKERGNGPNPRLT
jgi:antibiotic biosynthesis monooxygenase (ABM) superfamily enzyme